MNKTTPTVHKMRDRLDELRDDGVAAVIIANDLHRLLDQLERLHADVIDSDSGGDHAAALYEFLGEIGLEVP